MDFCKNCGNMYYITLSDDSVLHNFCRNCGDKSEVTKNGVMLNYDISVSSDVKLKNAINQYTKYDPTIPISEHITCCDAECVSNTETGVKPRVLYIKYDNDNLKFVYLCYHCDKSWTN